MILTDYYKFEKLPGTKSKHRVDCTASTRSYPEFEALRNKAAELFVYIGDVPDRFGGNIHRKADKAITKVKNISSIYVPDVTAGLAYGDIRGTQDAVLIINDPEYTVVEVFIARGYRNNRLNLWQNLSDGAYDEEIADLRARATAEMVEFPSSL